MPRLDCENALDFAREMFIAAGVPTTEAQRVATSLVDDARPLCCRGVAQHRRQMCRPNTSTMKVVAASRVLSL